MELVFFIFFLSILLIDFKKGVAIYAPFKMFFYEGFQLFSFASFDASVSLVVFLIYLLKHRTISNKTYFPWKKSFIVLLIVGIIYSCYPALNLGELLRETLCLYVYAYILFCSINNETNLKVLIWSCYLFIILLAGDGIVELITKESYIGNFHESFYRGEFNQNGLIRYGNLNRIRSFAGHSISFGILNVAYVSFFIYLMTRYKCFSSKVNSLIIIMCLMCIILSGSRTPLLGFAVIIIPYIFLTKNKSKSFFIILFLIIGLFTISYEYLSTMFGSLINQDKYDVEGSTIDGRIIQFGYTLELIKDNWLLGMGSIDIMNQKKIDYSILYGAESIWMVLLLKKGLLGVLSYVYLYWDILKNTCKIKKNICFIFFIIGWLIMDSSSSMMGISFFLPIMFFILFYKTECIFEKSC